MDSRPKSLPSSPNSPVRVYYYDKDGNQIPAEPYNPVIDLSFLDDKHEPSDEEKFLSEFENLKARKDGMTRIKDTLDEKNILLVKKLSEDFNDLADEEKRTQALKQFYQFVHLGSDPNNIHIEPEEYEDLLAKVNKHLADCEKNPKRINLYRNAVLGIIDLSNTLISDIEQQINNKIPTAKIAESPTGKILTQLIELNKHLEDQTAEKHIQDFQENCQEICAPLQSIGSKIMRVVLACCAALLAAVGGFFIGFFASGGNIAIAAGASAVAGIGAGIGTYVATARLFKPALTAKVENYVADIKVLHEERKAEAEEKQPRP